MKNKLNMKNLSVMAMFICVCLSFTERKPDITHRYIVTFDGSTESLRESIATEIGIAQRNLQISKIQEPNIFRLWLTSTDKKSNIGYTISEMESIHQLHTDSPVEYRREPNDPEFDLQRHLKLIDADRAWDFTTGGMTINGHEIVVAVLDDGFSEHEDLSENLWINEGEIPNNEIDDDNNGYVDDYTGVNIRTGNDNHVLKSHGTGVAGIIGAKGDNGIGITGVNWNVKLMLISNVGFASEIIEANNYVRTQRQLYNDTNGAEGAFVVAANFSAGIPEAFESDQPIMCESYNSLGEVGVLSISAPPNRDVDIDIIGDLPAHCSSPYLIIVTNTDVDNDELFERAGFGLDKVDIGAPGQGSISTRLDNEYDAFGGTSAAAPHVSGAVSLLYSVACSDFQDMIDQDPQAAAIQIKNLILNNTDEKTSLQGKTVSGGRLNIFKSMIGLRPICGIANGQDLSFVLENPISSSQEVSLMLKTPFLVEHQLFIHNTAGQLMYQQQLEASLFGEQEIVIENLKLNTGIFFVTIAVQEEIKTVQLLVAD